ncbi:MAG: acyltransferase [Methanobrevibacter sp.]|nr:acyltransferase [Methanobrevibacter sp.]MBQ6630305.1 acyltransferase [Methanobrevibacter sp.]
MVYHATDGIYIISSDAIVNYTIYSRIFNFASLFIGRIGVPFFLMISGYLLLDRAYDDERIRKFWNTSCKGLVIVTVIWAAIYVISLQFLTAGSPQVNYAEAGTLFFSHMWYMPMIIGMYLSMPFVASALNHFDVDTIYQATIAFTLLAFLLPFVTLVCKMHGIDGVAIQYCLGFSGGIYGIYIILGYLVKKGKFLNVSSLKLWVLAIVSFLVCILFQYYAFVINYDFFLWYEFPFILLGSFALFELCSRVKTVRFYSWVTVISKYSFAVFLIHNIFRLPLLPLVVQLPFSEPVKAIVLWILLVVFSFTAAAIIYRIPRFGKYILYMR